MLQTIKDLVVCNGWPRFLCFLEGAESSLWMTERLCCHQAEVDVVVHKEKDENFFKKVSRPVKYVVHETSPASPLHNLCISKKAVLLKMLQVSESFGVFLLEPRNGICGRLIEVFFTSEQTRQKTT